MISPTGWGEQFFTARSRPSMKSIPGPIGTERTVAPAMMNPKA